MKIAIAGGGFTGLSAALTLAQQGHQIILYEKEKKLGGLAGSYRQQDWDWSVEQHYHHWFTNDIYAINLIKKLGLEKKLIFPDSLTSIYYKGKIFPFNSISQILSFSPLSLINRFRIGAVSLYLKFLPPGQGQQLEKFTASEWISKYYGNDINEIVWKPLLTGKFGPYSDSVNMAWFWARIKKRTLKLGYLEGGYQTLVDAMEKRLNKLNVTVKKGASFKPGSASFDKTIITVPSPVFLSMYPDLPENYKQKITSIPHLYALNLLLITDKKILKDTYWLNINDRSFPFIAVIQQTNMTDSKNYGRNNLAYIANYLPPDHPFLKMSEQQLFMAFLPYLKKINPDINTEIKIKNLKLFVGPYAQPVFPVNYSKIKPDFETPIPDVYLANMDMVYPWDRGTNYAIELGENMAKFVDKRSR